MLRAEILAWLQDEFSAITKELKMPITDTSTGYAPVLDSVQRAFGLTTPEIPTAALIEGTNYVSPDDVFIIAAYFALQRFLRKATAQVSVNVAAAGVSKSSNQTFDHIKALYDQAIKDAVALVTSGRVPNMPPIPGALSGSGWERWDIPVAWMDDWMAEVPTIYATDEFGGA